MTDHEFIETIEIHNLLLDGVDSELKIITSICKNCQYSPVDVRCILIKTCEEYIMQKGSRMTKHNFEFEKIPEINENKIYCTNCGYVYADYNNKEAVIQYNYFFDADVMVGKEIDTCEEVIMNKVLE